jgi:hypothetical protein
MVPSSVPLVRPTNTPANSFQICSAQAASVDCFVARTLFARNCLRLLLLRLELRVHNSFPSSSPKEALASLQSFSSSSDKMSDVLDNDTFIDFQDWFSASLWNS